MCIGSETIIVSCLWPTYVSVATLTHVTVMAHVSMSEYRPLIDQLMASDWSGLRHRAGPLIV